MILSSISRHIKEDFCPSLLELSPIQRSEVAEHFSNLKSQFGERRFSPHELSPNEKIAASICSILGYRYKMEFEELMQKVGNFLDSSWTRLVYAFVVLLFLVLIYSAVAKKEHIIGIPMDCSIGTITSGVT